MTSPIQLYEALTSAPDDKTRARIIAEAFERMEERYPEVKDLATRTALSETELRLQKEIEGVRLETEQVRKEIAEVEGRLRLEIEQLRKEIAEVEGRLRLEIEQVRKEIADMEGRLRLEIEQVRKEVAASEGRVRSEIAEARASTLRWVVSLLAGQTVVIIAALFAIARP
jgi:chromosome segregation ATPase